MDNLNSKVTYNMCNLFKDETNSENKNLTENIQFEYLLFYVLVLLFLPVPPFL